MRPSLYSIVAAAALLLSHTIEACCQPVPTTADVLELTGSFLASWAEESGHAFLRSDGMIAHASREGVHYSKGVSTLSIIPIQLAQQRNDGSTIVLPTRDRRRLYRIQDGAITDSLSFSTLGQITVLGDSDDRTLFCTSAGEVVLTKAGSLDIDQTWNQYSVTCASASRSHITLAGSGFVRVIGYAGTATDTVISMPFSTGLPTAVATSPDASLIAVSVRGDTDTTLLTVSRNLGPFSVVDTSKSSYLLVPGSNYIIALSRSSSISVVRDSIVRFTTRKQDLLKQDVFAFEPRSYHVEDSTIHIGGAHAFIGAWDRTLGWSVQSYIPGVPFRTSTSVGSADRGVYLFQGFGGTLLQRNKQSDAWIPKEIRGSCLPSNTSCRTVSVAPDSTIATLWNEVSIRTVVNPNTGKTDCGTSEQVTPSFFIASSTDTLLGYNVINAAFMYSTDLGRNWRIYARPQSPPSSTLSVLAFQPSKAIWTIENVQASVDTTVYRSSFIVKLSEYRGGELVRSTEFPAISSLRSWVVRNDSLYAITLSNEISRNGSTSLALFSLSEHAYTTIANQQESRLVALALQDDRAYVSDYERNVYCVHLSEPTVFNVISTRPPLQYPLSWIALVNDTTLIGQTSSTPLQQLVMLKLSVTTTSIRNDAAPREDDVTGPKTLTLDVAPNPSSSMFMIALPSELLDASTQSARISIVDVLGNEIHQETVLNSDMSHNSGVTPTHRIDCNNWMPGVYMITLTTGRAAAHGRVIRN